MKTAISLTILATALVTASPLFAQGEQTKSKTVTTAPGTGTATERVRTTATIVALDPTTRTISLKKPNGQISEITAGPEIQNFDKLRVGQVVTAEYQQALSLELRKGSSGIRERAESTTMSRGSTPGGSAQREVTVLADVVAVNQKNQKVTLRGPKGTVELKIQDPDQLKNVKVGDQVQAVYKEALAIAVQPSSTSSGQ